MCEKCAPDIQRMTKRIREHLNEPATNAMLALCANHPKLTPGDLATGLAVFLVSYTKGADEALSIVKETLETILPAGSMVKVEKKVIHQGSEVRQ